MSKDRTFTEKEIIARIKIYIAKFNTAAEAAEAMEISPQYLSDILLEKRALTVPLPKGLKHILALIGAERVVRYRNAR